MALFDYQRLSYWAMNSFLPATPHHLEAIHLDFYSSWRSNMEFQSVTDTRICLRIPYSIYFMMILYIYIYSLYTILYISYYIYIVLLVYYIYMYYILYISFQQPIQCSCSRTTVAMICATMMQPTGPKISGDLRPGRKRWI